MGKPTGFMEIERQDRHYQPATDRIQHYDEFVIPLEEPAVTAQGSRCMDCGIPYCHNGCPVNNLIPDWNDLVYRGEWQRALQVLHSTNNFPEFTGRICPAPCEAACTLNLTDYPVTIKTIECAIIDRAWENDWITPQIPLRRSGKKVAVVGSGPAGLACAQQLARVGHEVVVYEKQDRVGGLLRYGIPDFKLSKRLIDRRVAQMQAEGVVFRANCHIGVTIPARDLTEQFDAVVLAGGSEQPRPLPENVTGQELPGVHFAMDFLRQQNKRNAGDTVDSEHEISATGKHVVVIGGGDTGSDCIGTSIRQQAASVVQLEILPKPPEQEDKEKTWPNWPNKLRTSSSQEEGCNRDWSVTTKRIEGNGRAEKLIAARVEWKQEGGRWVMNEVEGSEFALKADLVLLAMGFVHPVQEGLLEQLNLSLDNRKNVLAPLPGAEADTLPYQTSRPKVFAAGDMRRGQSLVVWAIREGRQCARAVDTYLMGESDLPN